MPPTTYSTPFRVIGQELERRKAVDFEVAPIRDGFRVSALVPAATRAAVADSRRGWKLFGGRTKSAPPKADEPPVAWERDYSWAELEQLDDRYRTQRAGSDRSPEDYATSQVLRVIGAFAEDHRWAVTGVKRQGPFLEIQHRDRRGEVETWAEKYADLYDFAFRLRSRRTESVDHV